MLRLRKLAVIAFAAVLSGAVLVGSGCTDSEAKAPAPQALPVKTETVNLAPVPRVDEYVATVKSRRSASIQPQVDGSLRRILVKSGDHVRAGQVLMTIDPLKQQAFLAALPQQLEQIALAYPGKRLRFYFQDEEEQALHHRALCRQLVNEGESFCLA